MSVIDRLLKYNFAPGSCMPASASLLLTGRCNLRCGMCSFWRTAPERDQIDETVWADALEQLRDMGVDSISFQGGEPTLYRGIEQLACRASGLGFRDRQVITNGTLPAVLERLLPYLSIITFSLDSIHGGVHDGIRGVPGTGDRVRETMLAFVKKIPVRWAMVIQEKNHREVDEALSFASANGIREMVLALVAGATVSDSAYADEKLYRHIGNMEKSSVRGWYNRNAPRIQPSLYDTMLAFRRYRTTFVHRCDEPGTTVIILPDGGVHICCGNLPPVGNIRNDSLRSIWSRPETGKIMREARNGMLSPCRSCQHVRTYFNAKAIVYNVLFSPRMAFTDYFLYRLLGRR